MIKMTSRHAIIAMLLLLSQLFWGEKAHATIARAAGAEIQYKHLSDSTYIVYYKYYQPCDANFPEPLTPVVCYRNYTTTCPQNNIWHYNVMQKMVLTPNGEPNGQMLDQSCPGQGNTCTNPSSTVEMYRVWWYSTVVTLTTCGVWTLSVNTEDRDVTATNLVPLAYPYYNLYVEALINTGLAPDQSSPFSTTYAPIHVAAGSPFHYNMGFDDPDNDALKYISITPQSAQADFFVACAGYSPYNLTYASGFNNAAINPVLSNNTFSINAQNGDVNFTPVAGQNQIGYLTYKIEKYRNGVLIGSIMMDHRIEIKTTNTIPQMQVTVDPTTVQGGVLNSDTLSVCSGTKLNFCFNASSTTAGAHLQASDNHDLVMNDAVITYQNQGTATVNGCVQWTPHNADVGFFYFIVKVKDVSCTAGNAPMFQTYKIPIMVKQGTEILVKDSIICPGASAILTASSGTTFSWASNPAGTFSCSSCGTTNYTPSVSPSTVTLHNNITNGCSTSATVHIYWDNANSINATPDTTVYCDGIGGYVQFNAVASGPAPLKTISCGANSPQVSTGLTDVDMMQNSNNSNSSNAYWININSFWGPFYQVNYTQKSQVIFHKDELVAAGMQSSSIQKVYLNFGTNPTNTNPTFSNVKIAMRCTDKNDYTTPFLTEFQTGLTDVFSAASYTIVPGINEFVLNIPYDYDTSKNLCVQFCYSGVTPQVTVNSASSLPIYWVSTPYKSYISAAQNGLGDACSNNVGQVTLYDRRPDMRFSFNVPPANFQYTWTPSNNMSNPSAASTGINVDSSRWFTVSTTGLRGCVVKDSVYVYVADNHFTVNPQHSDICIGEVVRLEGIGGTFYNWFNDQFQNPQGFSCINCDTPNVTAPLGQNQYKVIVADAFHCSDTLDVSINVNPVPTTHILNNDTTINYGASIQLFAEGASFYSWIPANSVNAPSSSSPFVAPTNNTMYIVTGYAVGGCAVKDSVFVKVNLHEKVLIPSAFSPNGDGLNDVFKIENLKFEKVVAFSVYDRWGNEVYKAPLNQNGWDGTYKGQPMPLGTYFYFIQLYFPDGETETYKGDVTLIR